MSAIAAEHAAPSYGWRQGVLQARELSRRSIAGSIRQPQVWLPGLIFPMFIAAVNTSTMGQAPSIPGFPPVDSLLDFLLVASITQSVLFGGLNAGADTATDIQTGFFDRLIASPVARTSILVGRLAGAAFTGAVQAVIFMVVYGLFGVRIAAGPIGAALLVVYAVLLALLIGGFAAMIALRTGQAEAVQNTFPLTFVLLFISSAFFPTELMTGLYQSIAEKNPITWMIDGMREQVIVGLDWSDAFVSLGLTAGFAALTIFSAHRALRARLRSAG